MLITREITFDNLHPDLLKYFNRYQLVQRCWRNDNGEWKIKNICYTEQWNEQTKSYIINCDFSECLKSGGFIWGVFDENKLIAFACLSSEFFGSEKQYLQLKLIQVSCEYRNRGIGKTLFGLCSQKARDIGAKKLYISANSSEQSQCFYKSVGCSDAIEINEKLAEDEPFDRQMEYYL